MKSIFITGTDTGVGKTIVSSYLMKKYAKQIPNLKYWKPIQTGFPLDNDSQIVKQIANLSDDYIEPGLRFQLPTSPHFAAEKENKIIKVEQIDHLYQKIKDTNHLIIEGAGGLFVPLNRYYFWLDWIHRWNLPVIIASRSTLGTINHTILTVKAIESKNIKILGIIFCGKHDEEYILDNFKTIQEITKIPMISFFDIHNDLEIDPDPNNKIYKFFLDSL